ncbi:MAG TPA: hypothetical protein VMT24_16555 [Aggregatilineaceae bacterium]|nr:hypothetical protein [Aggregatilineaceae bacterium]
MAVNPQPGGSDDPGDVGRVQEYQRLVLEYEALDEQIDELLERHHGTAEKMSPDDLKRYRELARRRDDVHNRMKVLEQRIFQDDDNS